MNTLDPTPGDEWEFQLPGKRKRRKIVDEVRDSQRGNGEKVVWWRRLNKGRYTGIKVEALKRHGRRISTQAEREAWNERKIWLEGRPMYRFTLGELWAGSDGMKCEGKHCRRGRTFTLWLTTKEFLSLPAKEGPDAAALMFKNGLGKAYCAKCVKHMGTYDRRRETN
jgi:hypothetical protein